VRFDSNNNGRHLEVVKYVSGDVGFSTELDYGDEDRTIPPDLLKKMIEFLNTPEKVKLDAPSNKSGSPYAEDRKDGNHEALLAKILGVPNGNIRG
jgi:hypothetical protein